MQFFASINHERRVLFWMCVLIAVNQLGFGSIIPVVPLYAQSFGVSQFAIGITVSVYGLARFAVAIPTGQIADGLGRRPALAIGGMVSAAGNAWCAVATSYEELVIARFVAGAGGGMVLTGGLIVLADITTPERRGRTMAIYWGTFLFAVGIGPLPGGWLAERFGLAAPFAAFAVAAVVAGMVAWFAVKETRDSGETATLGQPDLPPFREQLKLLMRLVGFRLVSILGFAHAITRTGALFSIVPVYVSVRLGLTPSQIGLGFALGSVLGLVATYPGGMLTDRFGRKSVIVPASFATGISMALFCVAGSYGGFLLAVVVWGMASAMGAAAPASYVADCAPPRMNAIALSTYRMLADLGYVIGPLALGGLADAHGAASALWISAAVMMAVAFVFARWAPETYRRKTDA